MRQLDLDIHQPTRLRIMLLLSGAGRVDFTFLCGALGLTEGNLSSHVSRLEEAGYVHVTKTFDGKVPNTSYRLTPRGRAGLAGYWRTLDEMRRSGELRARERRPEERPHARR